MVAIGPVVSEEKSFEIEDGRTNVRTDDGRTTETAYTISSPVAFGSGELKNPKAKYIIFADLIRAVKISCTFSFLGPGVRVRNK